MQFIKSLEKDLRHLKKKDEEKEEAKAMVVRRMTRFGTSSSSIEERHSANTSREIGSRTQDDSQDSATDSTARVLDFGT